MYNFHRIYSLQLDHMDAMSRITNKSTDQHLVQTNIKKNIKAGHHKPFMM